MDKNRLTKIPLPLPFEPYVVRVKQIKITCGKKSKVLQLAYRLYKMRLDSIGVVYFSEN